MTSILMVILALGTLNIGFSTEDEIVKRVSYSEAVKLAKKVSNTLETIDDKILLAERELKSAKVNSDRADTSGITSDSVLLENGKKKALYPSQKKEKLVDLQEEKMNAENDLKTKVLEVYNNIYNQGYDIKFKKDQLESLNLQYQNKNEEFQLGYITETELLEYQNNIESLEYEINSLETEYQKTLMDFNRLIGNPLLTETKLDGKVNLTVENLEYNLESLVEKAKDNSPAVRHAENDYLLKKLERDVIRRYTRYEKPDSYDDLKSEVEDLEEDYMDSKITAEINIYNEYFELLNARDDLKIAELEVELANRHFEIEKIKYKQEMSTFLEYKKKLDDLRTKEKILEDKKLALFVAKSNFDYYIEKLNYTFDEVLMD